MYYPFFDPTFILLVPAIILAFWAQNKVRSSYRRYSRIRSTSGLTGAQVAQARKVLTAAAWTYVAAATMTLTHLLRLILLRGMRN